MGRIPRCPHGQKGVFAIRVLITGGAGSFGQAFVRAVLPWAEHVVVYSRDEAKHARMAAAIGETKNLRFFLGDVHNRLTLDQAMWKIDTVVHAAALKRVDAVSYSVGEAIDTNIGGTRNVVAAAVAAGVRNVIALSSDKAVNPANMYGVTKLTAECYAIQANSQAYPRGTRVACVRYGNVLGSRGSVVRTWQAQYALDRPIAVTEPAATRFWMTMDEAVQLVLLALNVLRGGEVFIPRVRSMALADLATAVVGLHHPREFVGMRPGGEKFHETLLSEYEAARAVWVERHHVFVLEPTYRTWSREPWEGEPCGEYRSDTADRISVAEMQAMLAAMPPEVL